MRCKNFIILIFVLLVSFTLVSSINDFNCQILESQKDLALGKQIPDKAPFADEIINIYLSEEIYGNLQIENKTIKDFSCSKNENATYEIFIQDLSVVEDFLSSDDLLITYKEKSDSGEIKIKGIGFGKKIKLMFVKLFLKFA